MAESMEQIRAEISQARSLTEQKKREVEQTQAEIRQKQQALPTTGSQQSLRGKYAGIQGVAQRRTIAATGEQLAQQQQAVEEYSKGLSEYEQQISSAEQQLKIQEAYKNVEKVAGDEFKLRGIAQYGSGPEREIAKQYLENIQMGREAAAEIEKNPEKLTQLVGQLTAKGIPEAQAYAALGYKIAATPTTVPSQVPTQQALTDLAYRAPDTSGGLFPLVSAKEPMKAVPVDTFTKAPSLISRTAANIASKAAAVYTTVLRPSQPVDYSMGYKLYGITPTSVSKDILFGLPSNVGQTSAAVVEVASRPILGEKGIKIQGERVVQVPTPVLSRGTVQVSPVTGRPITTRPLVIPESRLTPAGLGVAANIATQFAIYKKIPSSITAVGGTVIATNKNLPVMERVGGGLLAVSGVVEKVRYLRTPVTITKPTREVATPQALEKIKVVQRGESAVTISKYKVVQEIKPPMQVIETTRVRDVLGLKPLKVTETPAVKSVTFTPFPVVGKKPFLVAEITQGKKYATVSRITGTSYGEVGTPVKQATSLEAEKLFRIKRVGGKVELFTPWKEGSRITRQASITQEVPVVETKNFLISKSRTVSADVTMPTGVGKARPVLETTIIRAKEPVVLDSGITSITPKATSPIKPQKTIQLEQITLPKPIKIVATPKTTRIVAKTIIEPPKTTALIYGISKYAGRGQYELTSGVGIAPPSQIQSPVQPQAYSSFITGGAIGVPQTIVPKERVYETIKLESAPKEKTNVIQTVIPIARTSIKPKEITISKPKQREVTKEIISELFKPATAQKQVSITQTKMEPKIRPKIKPPKIKPRIGPPPPIKGSGISNLAKAISKQEDIDIFVKRFGKDIKVAEDVSSLGKAQEIIRTKLKGSLARSGFVTVGGRKVQVDLGYEFRPSKKDPFRVVQKSKFSLGTRAEVGEIQFARKTGTPKRRKINFLR